MIKNNLEDIVKVEIEISTPGSSDESFSDILLVVDAPDKVDGVKKMGTSVIACSEPSELADYGFSSKHQAYIMAAVAFAQTPKPSVLYVTVRQYLLDESGEVQKTEDGKNVYEPISVCLDRAKETSSFYGIALAKEFVGKEDLEETIKWAESNKKLFGFTFVEETLPVNTTNFFRSFAVYGGSVPKEEVVPDENYYIALAMMAKCFGYEPGSETWGLQTLAMVYPCNPSTTMKKYCDDNQITYFTTYAKKNITSAKGGKVLGNEWIDTIRFRDWLQNDMQERIFNFLVQNQKVPYADTGITGIEGKMEETLKKGQEVGGIALTEFDEDNNEIPGYIITVPKSVDLTDTQKASRELVGCKFKAKLAGAIQAVEINGNLVYA